MFDAYVLACRSLNPVTPPIILVHGTVSEPHWNAPGIEPAFVPDLSST
jgi:hypothetical protein